MTETTATHRHPWTQNERAAYAQLAAIDWRAGSLDSDFVAYLSRASDITAKDSKRLFRLWGATKELREQA